MSNPPREKGTRWESKLLPVLRRAWPNAQRTGSRAYERGDFEYTDEYVIEAKDHKRITLADFMDQAKRAAERVGAGAIPVVIAKRRNKNVKQAYVIQELDDWIKDKERQCKNCSDR